MSAAPARRASGRPPAAAPRIRRAGPRDLGALAALERACFQPHRRASRASLARSLLSPQQSVWVVDMQPGRTDDGARPVKAMLVLWHFRRAARIYDIATHPEHRGQGIADGLLRHGEALARRRGATRMVLEADPTEPGLVAWYEKRGYRVLRRKPDFYGPGRHAVRMEKPLAGKPRGPGGS